MKVWIVTVDTTNSKDFETRTFVHSVHLTYNGVYDELISLAEKYGSKLLAENEYLAVGVYYDQYNNIIPEERKTTDGRINWRLFKVAKARPYELQD